MRIETDLKLDFKDVLIRPKRSTLNSRSQVELSRRHTFRNARTGDGDSWVFKNIPIMAANMDGVGTFEMAEALAKKGLFTCLVKHYPKHDLRNWIHDYGADINDHWAYSLGSNEADLIKFDAVYTGTVDEDMVNRSIKYVCIDVANGYSERFSTFVKKFRETYPRVIIIAGNVVTGEMTEELILNGADIVKVGIGPGSVCTTRIKTGVGYPQLSAIIECADAAHGLSGHIIADGGCTTPGDVAKAFGAGADFVMLGGMLAGHDEGGGEIKDGMIEFYGMSSDTAMEKHYGAKADYRSSEGRLVRIKHKGKVDATVDDILGGVRSACSYVGASELKHLSKCTTFIRVNTTHNTIFEAQTIK